MININKVGNMHHMAVMESGTGEKQLKIGSYKLADYIVREIAIGIIFGTICFMACCALWFFMKWDDLNIYFYDADFAGFFHLTVRYYIRFMIVYLGLCTVAAIVNHRSCRKFKEKYLENMEEVRKIYNSEDGDK